MALDTNFNINPYFDDFDQTKNYLRLLFKPGYAVQSRELTQIQSVLQNQIERFGNNIFKNGSVVTGGQFFLQNVTYLKLDSTYSGNDINVDSFDGMTILSNDETKRAEVIKVYSYDSGTDEPITLLVKQIYGDDFVSGDVIKTKEDSPVYATVSEDGVGTGQTFSVNEGVFYYDGFFIGTNPQTIATSKYTNNTANVRIGFEITESLVTYNTDTSLLDPAQFASNYQAPGADRYNVTLSLSTRTLDSTDDTKFIELARVNSGIINIESNNPTYSVLEDTLARRTYDESGNYSVKPFNISLQTNAANTAQTELIFSPGKAYVYGYEYETNSPTKVTVDKPRTTTDIQNKRISSDFGNYVYTTNHKGSFPINSLETANLHCVQTSTINTSSVYTVSNTNIGTARIKTVAFESASNTSNASTYQYKTFLFDINVGSITGNVASTGSTTTSIVLNGTSYSSSNTSYVGAKFRITSGTGLTSSPKTIIGYNGVTKTIQLSSALTEIPTGTSLFSIDFDLKDVESIVTHNGTTLVNGADIDVRSKDTSTDYDDVFITDSSLEPLILYLGDNYIAPNTISDMSFSYKRLYQNQSFSSSLSPALVVGSGEDIASGSTTSNKLENFYISVTSQGTSPYTVGSVIPSDKFTVDAVSNRITVVNGNNMIANIVSTIDVSTTSRKNKTYVPANTTIQITNGVDVFSNSAVISYGSNGQCHILSDFVNKTSDVSQSLFVSDVTDVIQILDFNGYTISSANTVLATDVTNKYLFDNGQRDSYYDHSSIKLKPNVSAPVGDIVVFYNRFTSSGSGFFTVDSYRGVTYEEIPVYSSTKNNTSFYLRDCIDFRPVRSDATAGSGSSVLFDVDSTTVGPKIPKIGSDIVLDYSYYLPRIDKVVVDKSKRIEVIKGNPSISPVAPADSPTGMTIFILSYSPYVSSINDINVKQISNKRYTMKDIGNIEKRVENLEYYTSLSLLEQDTISKQDLTILDTQNVPRFKNGILVDSFVGHSVSDVTKPDYICSIDSNKKELRPSFNISSYKLNFDSANSSNYTQTGQLISAQSSENQLINQPLVSKWINVNPFNVVNYLGKVRLYPESDIWIDTEKQPDVLVNLNGDNDAWQLIAENAISYNWNSWNTIWSGVETNIQSTTSSTTARDTSNQVTVNAGISASLTTVTSSSIENQTRTGIATYVTPQTITQSIGNRVVDVSIIPYMRSINVLFTGSSFKPNTVLYSFFDKTNVDEYVSNRVNKFVLHNNGIGYNTDLSNPEILVIKDKDTDDYLGECLVVSTSNNIVYVTNLTASSNIGGVSNVYVTGSQTSISYDVTEYQHNGGKVVSATSNTVSLGTAAIYASNYETYIGSTITITDGTGAGQTRTISAYDPSTGIATISTDWVTAPSSDSWYGIGNLTTDPSGSVVGIFTIPSGTFRVGEKSFRLTDWNSTSLYLSQTNGDATFYAQGLLQSTEETVVSSIVPTIQRTTVTDSRIVTNTVSSSQSLTLGLTVDVENNFQPITQIINNITQPVTVVQQWVDPLAETFLISPQLYPYGLYLTKLRFCFKSKDDLLPITVQLRTTNNGYPSGSVVYPFSTVTLTADKVKVSDTPNLDDDSSYTDFVFESPVYLQPGEHSFVIMSNSSKYEVYAAEIGKLDINTGRQISEQPYNGSLFLSQNGSTWTPDQNSDLMFRMFMSEFSSDEVTAQFTLSEVPSTDFEYNTIQVSTSDIVMKDTSLNYYYKTEKTTGDFTDFASITPSHTYELKDKDGVRIINTATGNDTFVLKSVFNTNTPSVSPIVDMSRVGVITVGNIINDLPLSNDGIVIVNSGVGYPNASAVSVTISGGGGSGATAVANVVSNTVDAIYIIDGGSGYTSSPTFTITSSGDGAGAIAQYNGETEKSGGNAVARYITRRVTLADGFDSGDLRLYITANKPSGTNIHAYYKILSVSDPELFDDKKWTLMTEIGNSNFSSLSDTDYRELIFAPGENGVAYNQISYETDTTSYSTFRTFAIKLVMTSQTSSIVPKVRDLRAIALPAA